MPLRVIDAGNVPPLRSQALYHGIATVFEKDTPNTVVLCTPAAPYVCIGCHQNLEAEVNASFCERKGLPIVRREVGGGAVYLDRNQIFTQWIFHPQELPMRVMERFRLHALPLLMTYRQLGIGAAFRPINDIQVGDRKIGGMGAGAIGNAEVVVCSFLLDFDFEIMAGVLRSSGADFHDKVLKSLRRYMTTVRLEIGGIPPVEKIKEIYLTSLEKTLGRRWMFGKLSAAEAQAVAQKEATLGSREWVYSPGGHRRPAVKIHNNVWIGELQLPGVSGPLKATVRLRNNCIDELIFSGDCRKTNPAYFSGMEAALQNAEADRENIHAILRRFDSEIVPAGELQQWTEAIVGLAQAVQRS